MFFSFSLFDPNKDTQATRMRHFGAFSIIRRRIKYLHHSRSRILRILLALMHISKRLSVFGMSKWEKSAMRNINRASFGNGAKEKAQNQSIDGMGSHTAKNGFIFTQKPLLSGWD